MPSTESLAAAIGVPEGAAEVYLLLLDRPTSTVDELAAASGQNPDAVAAHVGLLRDHGLALRAKAAALSGGAPLWAAAEPDHALREAVRRREETLNDVRLALPALQSRFHLAHDDTEGRRLEHLEGWENVGNRYHHLLRDATGEISLLEHGPYTPGRAPTEESILERGVRFRVMCDPVDFPDELAEEFGRLRSLEARLHPDIPFRGVIVDRRVALITMDRDPQNRTAVVVHPSPLLDGLALLFDSLWSRAVPLSGEGTALAVPERQVLTLLATGLKDEAIARQLNTTTRTVRRRVQAVITALHAKSRFHAGVEARRRGWI